MRDTEDRKQKSIKRALKLPARELAVLAGVTKRTAQGWITRKKIPEKSQVFLREHAPEARPRRLPPTEVDRVIGLFDSNIYTVAVGAILTSDVMMMLAEWSASLPKYRGLASYQFVASGRMFVEPAQAEMNGSSKVLPPPKGEQAHLGENDVVLPGTPSPMKSEAFESFIEELNENEQLVIYILKVSLYVRRPYEL